MYFQQCILSSFDFHSNDSVGHLLFLFLVSLVTKGRRRGVLVVPRDMVRGPRTPRGRGPWGVLVLKGRTSVKGFQEHGDRSVQPCQCLDLLS